MMESNRRWVTVSAALLAAICFAVDANGQLPTTVQLPSFSFFSYSGTVVVPDQGAAYLGGVNRSATGLNRRGLSRGLGSASLRSQASLHATIIDHRELDQQLLGGTPKEFLRDQPVIANQPNRRQMDPTEEGKALVRYARKLYREGNRTGSFDTYRMAIDVLPPDLRSLAEKEFKRAFGSAATQALRMSSLRR